MSSIYLTITVPLNGIRYTDMPPETLRAFISSDHGEVLRKHLLNDLALNLATEGFIVDIIEGAPKLPQGKRNE